MDQIKDIKYIKRHMLKSDYLDKKSEELKQEIRSLRELLESKSKTLNNIPHLKSGDITVGDNKFNSPDFSTHYR